MARRRKLSMLAGALLAVGVATAVWAYLTAVGIGAGNAAVTTLATPDPVSASSPSTASAHVTWTAVPSPSGTASDVTYTVERSSNGGSSYSPASGTCAGTLAQATTSCNDTLTVGGNYVYRVNAFFKSWTSSGVSNSVTVVVDATPPTSTITFPASAAFYNAAGYTAGCTPGTDEVCGTANDPGTGASGVNKVQVSIQRSSDNKYWDGSAWVAPSTWNDASGTTSWSYGFAAANLTNGNTYTVRSRAIDNASNTQTTPDSKAFTFDTAAPSTTITLNPASPNGSSSWYKTTAPTFTLSASDASGSGVAGTFYKIDGGAQQSYTAAVTIPEGQHTISYWSTDDAGNLETTHTTATIKVDVTAPVTTIAISPASPNGSSSWYKTTAPTFTLSASDTTGGNSGVGSSFYKIDSGAQQTYSGAVTIPEGQHTISYWSQDVAGNVETTHTTATIKVDVAAPATTIAVSPASPNGSNGWYKTTAPTFTLTASDTTGGNSGVGTTFYQIDSGVALTYSSAVTIPEGQHTITYWSQDVAGNVEGSHTTATIKVDTSAPTLALKTIAPSSAVTYGAGLSGTTVFFQSCPAGSYGYRFVSTVTDSTSGPSSAAYPTLSASQWTTHSSETISTPSSGPYTSSDFLWTPNNCGGGAAAAPSNYTITASDAAGNTATVTVSFSIDNTAPTVTNVTLNDGGTSSGTIAQNDFVEVTYSEVMDATSFCSTWVNGSAQSLTSGVTVTVTTVDVLSVSATGCAFHFGSVTLNANYNSSASSAMTFTTGSQLIWDPATKKLKVLLGSRSGGTAGTVSGSSTPSYQNSNPAREGDFAQLPVPTSSVNGTSSHF